MALSRSIIFSLDSIATILVYFVPKFLATRSTTRRTDSWIDQSYSGSFNLLPSTNRFLRYFTNISAVTMVERGDDGTEGGVDQAKIETNESSEHSDRKEEKMGGNPETPSMESSSQIESSRARKQITEQQETIAMLKMEIEGLRRRLVPKNSNSSEQKSSIPDESLNSETSTVHA